MIKDSHMDSLCHLRIRIQPYLWTYNSLTYFFFNEYPVLIYNRNSIYLCTVYLSYCVLSKNSWQHDTEITME